VSQGHGAAGEENIETSGAIFEQYASTLALQLLASEGADKSSEHKQIFLL